MKELAKSVCTIVVEQVKRIGEEMGREDSGAHESFGHIKQALEEATAAAKPLEKTLKEYWGEVTRHEKDTQAAMLRQMQTEAERATAAYAELSARIARGMAACAGEKGKTKLGQMEFSDITEEAVDNYEPEFVKVDPETGEVLEE